MQPGRGGDTASSTCDVAAGNAAGGANAGDKAGDVQQRDGAAVV